MSRTLYHFTHQGAIERVRVQGLTRGVLPWKFDREGNPHFVRGIQWLTTNPNFAQQWCMLGNLPYTRNAWRVTIAFPSRAETNLFNWLEFCRVKNPDSAEEINRTGGDVNNWWLHRGPIPTSWFIAIEPNLVERMHGERKGLEPA